MSRYTGPRLKVMRALGTELPGLSNKRTERRPYPPGVHGQKRRKISEYGVRLMEKQKVRMNYGLTEKQMRRVMLKARASDINTGNKFIELLERRLDNIVFRIGWGATIPAARQLVNHGHVLVNGRRVDIPSCLLGVGDRIELRARSRKLKAVEVALGTVRNFATPWLEIDNANRSAKVLALPDDTAVLFSLDIQLVVEFYSQSL